MLGTLQTDEARSRLFPSRNRAVLDLESHYRCRNDEHELVLVIPCVTRRHALAVERGEVEFALVADGAGLLLGFRIGSAIPWSAAVFEEAGLPLDRDAASPRSGPAPERRILVHIELMDGRTRVICATRNATVSLDFSRVLRRSLAAGMLVSWARPGEGRDGTGFFHAFARPELHLDHVVARSFGSD